MVYYGMVISFGLGWKQKTVNTGSLHSVSLQAARLSLEMGWEVWSSGRRLEWSWYSSVLTGASHFGYAQMGLGLGANQGHTGKTWCLSGPGNTLGFSIRRCKVWLGEGSLDSLIKDAGPTSQTRINRRWQGRHKVLKKISAACYYKNNNSEQYVECGLVRSSFSHYTIIMLVFPKYFVVEIGLYSISYLHFVRSCESTED